MSSLFAFPGQGAQQAGMLQRLPEGSAALLEEASDVLGEQVLTLDSPQALQATPVSSRHSCTARVPCSCACC